MCRQELQGSALCSNHIQPRTAALLLTLAVSRARLPTELELEARASSCSSVCRTTQHVRTRATVNRCFSRHHLHLLGVQRSVAQHNDCHTQSRAPSAGGPTPYALTDTGRNAYW